MPSYVLSLRCPAGRTPTSAAGECEGLHVDGTAGQPAPGLTAPRHRTPAIVASALTLSAEDRVELRLANEDAIGGYFRKLAHRIGSLLAEFVRN